jgi:hypothetical protein
MKPWFRSVRFAENILLPMFAATAVDRYAVNASTRFNGLA